MAIRISSTAIVDLERIITYYVHSSSAVNIETFRNNSIYIRDRYFCSKDVFIILARIISLGSFSYKNNTVCTVFNDARAC